jgi:hypothetical protein
MERRVLQAESQVWIGQPIRYPRELVRTLSKVYTYTKVKRAFLAHCCDPVRDTGGYTLIAMELDGSDSDPERVMAAIETAIHGVPVPDPPVDCIFFTGTGGIESSFVAAGIKPFPLPFSECFAPFTFFRDECIRYCFRGPYAL